MAKGWNERVEDGELGGVVTTHQLSDLVHRLMTIEACDVHTWPMKGIAQRLKSHPAVVQSLSRFRQAIDEIPQMGVQVISTTSALISAAAAISQQTGLLSNDALIVAVMRDLGLVHLASYDADFVVGEIEGPVVGGGDGVETLVREVSQPPRWG